MEIINSICLRHRVESWRDEVVLAEQSVIRQVAERPSIKEKWVPDVLQNLRRAYITSPASVVCTEEGQERRNSGNIAKLEGNIEEGLASERAVPNANKDRNLLLRGRSHSPRTNLQSVTSPRYAAKIQARHERDKIAMSEREYRGANTDERPRGRSDPLGRRVLLPLEQIKLYGTHQMVAEYTRLVRTSAEEPVLQNISDANEKGKINESQKREGNHYHANSVEQDHRLIEENATNHHQESILTGWILSRGVAMAMAAHILEETQPQVYELLLRRSSEAPLPPIHAEEDGDNEEWEDIGVKDEDEDTEDDGGEHDPQSNSVSAPEFSNFRFPDWLFALLRETSLTEQL